MGHYKDNNKNWCNAYSKEERKANEFIGELIETSKRNIKDLNKVKKHPLFKLVSNPIKVKIELYICDLKNKNFKSIS